MNTVWKNILLSHNDFIHGNKTKFQLLDTFKRHFIGSVISYKANIISHLVDDGGKVMTYSFH